MRFSDRSGIVATWISWYCDPRRNVLVAVSVLFRRRVVLNSCWAWRARRFVAAKRVKLLKGKIKSVERRGKLMGPSPPAEPLLLETNWNRFVIEKLDFPSFFPLPEVLLLTLTNSRLFRWQQRCKLWRISVRAFHVTRITFLVKLGSGFLPALGFVARRLFFLATWHPLAVQKFFCFLSTFIE